MAHFLRDEAIENRTIDRAAIEQLINAFNSRATIMPEYLRDSEKERKDVFLMFTIRFDGKGYRLFDGQQLLRHFDEAEKVDRVIVELQSGESLRSNRSVGSYLDLRLESDATVDGYLTSSSDDEDWMNGSFSQIKETLSRTRNNNSWIRNAWIQISIQIVGVLLGFALSLVGATYLSPFLEIENSFLISFLLVLLIFSNLWGPSSSAINRLIELTFPKIRFYRPSKDRLHWLFQAMVAGLVLALVLTMLSIFFDYAGLTFSRVISGN